MRYFGGIRRSDVRKGSLGPQATFVVVDDYLYAGVGTALTVP